MPNSVNLENDLDAFDKRLKTQNPMGAYDDSSDEESEQASLPKQPASQMDIMRQKNEILMEKLYHAEKKSTELKEAMDSVGQGASSDLKDKKIVELAKKNRAMTV